MFGYRRHNVYPFNLIILCTLHGSDMHGQLDMTLLHLMNTVVLMQELT